MGIRYYAYAFNSDQTEVALADPERLLSADPLADAWGFPRGAVRAVTNFEQSVPKSEMLYLDKAWSGLQRITASTNRNDPARPAARMFEGQVTPYESGWIAWVRAIMPEEVPGIATDLASLVQEDWHKKVEVDDHDYINDYLERSAEFTAELSSTSCGFVYMIG